MDKKTVSVVIPTWNEEGNIALLLRRTHESLEKNRITYEAIVIDDHSSDKTVAVVKKLSSAYPVRLFTKKGKKGKAQSVMEGIEKAQYSVICMIDADLQYPPEAIPGMVEKITRGADIVIANRKQQKVSTLRRVLSNGFKTIFGKRLFGLPHDVQAGMKVFTKEVWDTVKFSPTSGWTFDLTFLYKAREAGFSMENHDILFEKRKNGASKIGFIAATAEIGFNALALRLKEVQPLPFPSTIDAHMKGAGVGFKRKQYITHTTLHYSESALQTFITRQRIFLTFLLLIAIVGVIVKPIFSLQILVAILSFIYFVDVIFNLYLILKSLQQPQEIYSTEEEIKKLKNQSLPVYSILCPLYKETHIIPQFLNAINQLDYPKNKLDVLLLLEEDDRESIEIVKTMKLPSFVRTIIVPHSMPKTKPKACNYGLTHAKGEYLVIYDAEDIPDPLQLKKAFLAFQKVNKNVICLQAKLNYYNPTQNLLTRFFTAEYSLWFDVTLTGLQSVNTSIPLGGTSNHFRTKDLIQLQGWDPFNVTEDADLGIRLFKKGYKTAIIDSVTLEEANSKFGNWFRQRSRWIKGYMQTYLVHTRNPFKFTAKQKHHSLLFHLTIGGKIAFILINPLLWLATISYFALYSYVGPTIEVLYPPLVFYMAASSLVFGNFLFLYYYMIGCAKKNQWNLIKFTLLIPFYWLMISIAGFIALYQLLFKPHYWEKTVHGLHLKKTQKKALEEAIIASEERIPGTTFSSRMKEKMRKLIKQRKLYVSGLMLITATMMANVLNFLFNIYLGRNLSIDSFGELSLFTSLMYIISIPFGSFSSAVSHNIAYLFGKFSKAHAQGYLRYIFHRSIFFGIFLSALWFVLIPFLTTFFHTESINPILLFTPLWFISFVNSNCSGYFAGTLSFGKKGIVLVSEALIRLLVAIALVSLGLSQFIYVSIVISFSISTIISLIFAQEKESIRIEQAQQKFNMAFFTASILNSLSSITFLTLDVVLVKHFLDPVSAGEYGLLSLVGKITYFLGSLFLPFIIPLVSHHIGAKKDSKSAFGFLLFTTVLFCVVSFIGLGVFGNLFLPFVFGNKIIPVLPLLVPYVLAMALFTISQPIVSYFQAKENYSFASTSVFVTIFQITLMVFFHQNLTQVAWVMLTTSITNLLALALLYQQRNRVEIIKKNLIDLLELFVFRAKTPKDTTHNSLRILVFNWRDTKHRWAGGAETYIQQLAKIWVTKGSSVTIFCGNDGREKREEYINGVRIIRRGGFYTVYLWAFLYYTFKFKGKYDIIIDSENGIPFFTPLYAKEPVFLLIHHVHQEVFRKSLKIPFSWIAVFLEAKLMPLVYRNIQVITVSPSSKKEILKHNLTAIDPIIIYNGVNLHDFIPGNKSENPMVLYVGRLQRYKSLHILIKSAQKILEVAPQTQFVIAGEGEEKKKLEEYTRKLGLEEHISFLGKVSHQEKIALFQKAWVFVNPSLMEGWGITTIEANACATPAVASNVPGLQDSVKHDETGILVPYGKNELFADAINTLIVDTELREKLSKNAVKWASQFDWNVSSDRFYDVMITYIRSSERKSFTEFVYLQNKGERYEK